MFLANPGPDHKDDGLNASQSYLSERSYQRMNRIILLTSDLEFELVIYSGFELWMKDMHDISMI